MSAVMVVVNYSDRTPWKETLKKKIHRIDRSIFPYILGPSWSKAYSGNVNLNHYATL